MSGWAWAKDADGIVTITMDDPASAVNTMNAYFEQALEATVDRLEAERDDIVGVILASAKKTWFAGGDLTVLRAADPAKAAEEMAHIEHVKSVLRRLEKLGRPVVAAMSGTALGGGLEVALACHHRIAASDVDGARFGVPEVSLGLLPGGGGVTRLVRMLGLQKALQDIILPATRFRAEEALALGILDELAPLAELDARARAWIAANPAPVKPWDEKGFRIPGGAPSSPSVAAMLPAMPALLRAQVKGAPMPAPRAAMAAAVEGAYVDVDTASTIETRYFVSLTHSQVAKNMIKAFFFDRQVSSVEVSGGTGISDIARRLADPPGSFDARVGGAFLAEAVAAVGEGVEPASVEQAALQAGYPAGALQLLDELGLTVWVAHPSDVIDWMVDVADRPGREAGRGFYDYDESGHRGLLWPGLREQYGSGRTVLPFADLQERMLFAAALEAIVCLDEGVVASVADANIASISGIGFPAWTGGALQYVTQYDGGLPGFAARADQLADTYGERFRPPAPLRARAEAGGGTSRAG